MNKYILHIPHSSTYVPDYSGYLVPKEKIQDEINFLTDWATDKIFDVSNIDKIVVPFSRVFCDVERFYDEQEEMFAKGAGIAYTKLDSGEDLRKVSKALKQKILKEYYEPHHRTLDKITHQKLEKHGEAIIIDCHSFSSTPLKREFNQSKVRPDICIGTDNFHTPASLTKKYQEFFRAQGFQVAINQPYVGTIVPTKYYKKDQRVKSIMIEINKKLYMNEKTYVVDEQVVNQLNKIIEKLPQ